MLRSGDCVRRAVRTVSAAELLCSEDGQGRWGWARNGNKTQLQRKSMVLWESEVAEEQNVSVLNIVFVMDTNLWPHKQFKCK